MSTGPFLYDEGPEPLHTGASRRSGKWLVAIFGATVLVAVLLVVLMPLWRGTPQEQARETAGVLLAAMEQGDTETSDLLLCEDERNRLALDEVADAYLTGEDGSVVSAADGEEGEQLVTVRWADGTTSEWTVIAENGTRICGTTDG